MIGRRRNHSQSWARPWTYRYPAPLGWLSSFRRIRARRLWRPGQGVGYFYIGHAQFVETVLQEVFFRGRQIALGFFREQAERVDGLARPQQINPRLIPFFLHQPEL